MNLPLELHLAGRTGRSHHFPNYRAANHKILFIFHVEFADYFAFHFIGFFRKVSQKCFLFTKLLHLNFLSVRVFCSPISAQIQVEQNSL